MPKRGRPGEVQEGEGKVSTDSKKVDLEGEEEEEDRLQPVRRIQIDKETNEMLGNLVVSASESFSSKATKQHRIMLVDEQIHNYKCFGNPFRKIGKSWSQISCDDEKDRRAEWFKANRMSSLQPGTWEIEQKYDEEWFFKLYHVVESDMSPSSADPENGCLWRLDCSEENADAGKCSECRKEASAEEPLDMETLTANFYILVYLAISIYRAKWKIIMAKAVYEAKVTLENDDPLSIQICREHLHEMKIFMELTFLVWRIDAKKKKMQGNQRRASPIMHRIFAIAKLLQEICRSPENQRMNLDSFVEICYEQFLQDCRDWLPNAEVDEFVVKHLL